MNLQYIFFLNKIVLEKKVITIEDEDEEVMECKPEEFKKNIGKFQTTSFPTKDLNLKQTPQGLITPMKSSQSIHRKYEQKNNTKKSIKHLISMDYEAREDGKVKFGASNYMLKRNFFKKKPKKGFLSHRKKHRNQKRREVNFFCNKIYKVFQRKLC